MRALCCSSRAFSSSRARTAVTTLRMPSMSPTMEQGGISAWKLKEGESFNAGDVLLSIETDKAEIDVEAQDDGILGKILKSNGASGVKVGAPIALLAEQGDDLSNLQAPPEETPSAPEPTSDAPPAPSKAPEPPKAKASSGSHASHSSELPSVQRLLATYDVDASSIQGTGYQGRLTKGDVLAAAHQIKSATGSLTPERISTIALTPKFATAFGQQGKGSKAPSKKVAIKDEREYRGLFLEGFGLLGLGRPSPSEQIQGSIQSAPFSDTDYDAIFQSYLPRPPSSSAKAVPPASVDPLRELYA